MTRTKAVASEIEQELLHLLRTMSPEGRKELHRIVRALLDRKLAAEHDDIVELVNVVRAAGHEIGSALWDLASATREVARAISDHGAPAIVSVTQRRLRDGAAALALDMNISEMSSAELTMLRSKLVDGAVALQSTDDMGSDEANAKVQHDLEELERRIHVVNAALKTRRP